MAPFSLCNPRATSLLVVHRCCAHKHLIITVPITPTFSHCSLNLFAIRWFVIRGHREKPRRSPVVIDSADSFRHRAEFAHCFSRFRVSYYLRIPFDLYGMNYTNNSISWKEITNGQAVTAYINFIKLLTYPLKFGVLSWY